jgi:hypothetical protein
MVKARFMIDIEYLSSSEFLISVNNENLITRSDNQLEYIYHVSLRDKQ